MSLNKIIQQRFPLTTEKLSDNPLLNRLYQARGITLPQQLEYGLKNLHSPMQFANIEKMLDLLIEIYHQQKKIIIVGDFDADGATSTALTLLALKQLGFLDVDYLIPDRFSQGYGLSSSVAQMVIDRGAEVVITVDNGISSVEGVALLKQHHIQVLITDHHLPPDELPCADVIINPNLVDCSFPSKSLAGVGVIFYVMLALRSRMREQGLFKEKEPNLAELLDLVALGTVADVVPLDHNNRILVHQGINRIRSGYCRAGIKALVEIAKRNINQLKASDLGFSIAPRLNAAGRLENMALGVELLICDDMSKARQIAFELDSLNQTRKEFEQDMKTEALSICAKLPNLMQNLKAYGIVLYQPDWHQGVIGILASRIKDQFNRPVIAFAQESEDSEFIKGSARSISGLHMRDLLELIDQKHPDLILKFGGHAMAAGLTIHQDNFVHFQKVFDEIINQTVSAEQLQNIIYTDGELQQNEFNLETARLIQESGPWGQTFPEPLFEGEFKIIQQRLVGGKHLKMMVEIHNQLFDAILFNADLTLFPDLSIKTARLVYSLDINEFRGNTSLQLLVREIFV
ncbi:single-stranded-DNA-specific exonuclease RecJ [Phocoenobacter skyensis]|uniref:Single-stranded-DNA-specific exonuclease RecJ n=1 Tax=Phocoenobacter skyensis TaxID=97481 RepID=A0A1H7TZH1_9PAST|nr:single-stranded-DNA-specific exonuclease RecJ [Pasteurella skyensis]MDP8078675.1 single-stranded-DNA-specific exonuclease RecJ [Pasteurella skyensis]MDP8084669.1 single-stranded-DNA-specific exonuclease RecJ [Pasteurella skyensis]MDP8184185.1 single-stranded-DNA-specific exonuclease RecJ [Pasteurella skyensis]QLB22841.1 single-stranded-DNA-specific exonuclease RecJ [Pasteurella skyensis]SEL89924.1 single-stranded-DNA-specific exonuclease [Pasteurella skyensis]